MWITSVGYDYDAQSKDDHSQGDRRSGQIEAAAM